DVGRTLRVVVTGTNSAGSASATSAATTIVQAISTQPGLVALWHMDETSGTVMHDSIGSHNGTLFSVQPGLPGFLGFAYGFNGSAGYAELITGPSLIDGRWHTIQCVKTSSAIKVIVDGQTFSKAATVGSIANTTPVVIGARPGSDWTKGSLDEASIQIG